MNCPLCKDLEIRCLFYKDKALFMRCLRCGFKFAKVQTNANLQNSFEDYDEVYIQYLEDNVADEKNFQSILEWIGEHVNVFQAKVLDVGCGSGKFVRYLRHHSIDASGIEPSKALFDRYLCGESFYQNCTVESLSSQIEKPWKVITVLDVVEHVEDPENFIKALKKILAEDGFIFIVTPDVGSIVAKTLGRHWYFYHKYHLSYFSKRTFSWFCEMQGLHVKSWKNMKVYFPVGYVIRYIVKLISPRGRSSIARKFDRYCLPLRTGDRFGACLSKTGRVENRHYEER